MSHTWSLHWGRSRIFTGELFQTDKRFQIDLFFDIGGLKKLPAF
jgi:hypothetical protein